jgi:hypothetical protein
MTRKSYILSGQSDRLWLRLVRYFRRYKGAGYPAGARCRRHRLVDRLSPALLVNVGLSCVLGMVLGLGAASTASAASASTNFFGFGVANWQNGNVPEYQNYYNTTLFQDLMSNIGNPNNSPGASPPPMGSNFIRFIVPYNVFASSDGTSCLTPTTGSLSKIEAAVSDAENQLEQNLIADPQIPLVALGPDLGVDDSSYPAGDSPTWPTDLDLECATQAMETDFLNYQVAGSPDPLIGASGSGHPVLRIEAMNEPDVPVTVTENGTPTQVGLANACDPSNPAVSTLGPECAARYFGDVEQGNLDVNGGVDGKVIAGVFAGLNTASIPSNPTYNPTMCGSQPDFMEGYLCYLRIGDNINIPGGGTLQSYKPDATSWSFHDYADPKASMANTKCTSNYLYCVATTYIDFNSTLSTWKEPTDDEWITEAGFNHTSANGYTNLSQAKEVSAAHDWLTLADGVLQGPGPAHMFWYEWTTDGPVSGGPPNSGDTFDSALTDDNQQPRQAYCELVGVPLSDCAGAANNGTPPGTPNTAGLNLAGSLNSGS